MAASATRTATGTFRHSQGLDTSHEPIRAQNKQPGREARLFLVSVGAEAQTRTGDTCIFSAVLYRLSYLGARSMVGLRPGWVKDYGGPDHASAGSV
jgi:hypothetical protein